MFGVTRSSFVSGSRMLLALPRPATKRTFTCLAPASLNLSTSNHRRFAVQQQHNQQQRRWATNSRTSEPELRLTHFDAAPGKGMSESPHPMLFLHGAWDPPGAWEETAKHFSTLGHETAVLHWPGFRDGPPTDVKRNLVKKMVAQVKQAVQQLGPMTVVVAHCTGAYVAHKFLESWSVSGVALVNPVPPNPRATIDRWIAEQGIKGGLTGAEENLGYHGIFASAVEAPRLTLPQEKLFNMDSSSPVWETVVAQTDAPSLSLLKNMYDNPVVLEAKPVPVLVIAGRGDQVTTETDVQGTFDLHGIDSNDEEQVKWLPDTAGHLFVMHDDQARKVMVDRLTEWMDVHF